MMSRAKLVLRLPLLLDQTPVYTVIIATTNAIIATSSTIATSSSRSRPPENMACSTP
jgi:hypothetical protein